MAVWLPYRLARPWLTLDAQAPLMMTWGGLRGGISVALAQGLRIKTGGTFFMGVG